MRIDEPFAQFQPVSHDAFVDRASFSCDNKTGVVSDRPHRHRSDSAPQEMIKPPK
jgi:hypothetical protein